MTSTSHNIVPYPEILCTKPLLHPGTLARNGCTPSLIKGTVNEPRSSDRSGPAWTRTGVVISLFSPLVVDNDEDKPPAHFAYTMTTDHKPKPLPFVANFAAGAIAGISEILTFYPLDVVKTRMQLERGKAEHGLVGTFRNIIKVEGVGRLYRGLLPPLLLEAPKRAVKFASNDFWGKTFLELSGESKMTQGLSILTGCSAGATESFVVVPFELVKIKLQDKTSTYKGPADVVKQVVRKEGLLGLYAGMESTFWRHVYWNGGYFGSIYQVKAMLPKPKTPQSELLNNFISGSVGGCVGTILNTPFDVVKSRIQGAEKIPGVAPKYNWSYPALVTIAREEGFVALYKGFVPKVLRLAPGGGVLLLVVEFTLGVFRTVLGPPYV